jgi:hypothetical protein
MTDGTRKHCPNSAGKKNSGDDSQPDAVACIREGLLQAERGLGRPFEEVFDELERDSKEP